MFHQAFRKIRVTENKPKPDEIAILMEQRKQLKVEIARCQDDDKKEALEKQMVELDATLASECEEGNRRKVFENLDDIAGQDNVNNHGIWKVK